MKTATTKEDKLKLLAENKFSELEFKHKSLNAYMGLAGKTIAILYDNDYEIRVKPKELFVYIYKHGIQMISEKDDRHCHNLLRKFKAVECKWEKVDDIIGWSAILQSGMFTICKDGIVKHDVRCGEIDGTLKHFSLELLYEAKEAPELPSTEMEKVLPPEKIELLPERDVFNVHNYLHSKINELAVAFNNLTGAK